ncbi:hypothetical protein C8R44DRAFT_741908 [Mycena epipterygia]|nr:hypothetical protein C8R44DRAFT_741908 [Mycena epipterygia]
MIGVIPLLAWDYNATARSLWLRSNSAASLSGSTHQLLGYASAFLPTRRFLQVLEIFDATNFFGYRPAVPSLVPRRGQGVTLLRAVHSRSASDLLQLRSSLSLARRCGHETDVCRDHLRPSTSPKQPTTRIPATVPHLFSPSTSVVEVADSKDEKPPNKRAWKRSPVRAAVGTFSRSAVSVVKSMTRAQNRTKVYDNLPCRQRLRLRLPFHSPPVPSPAPPNPTTPPSDSARTRRRLKSAAAPNAAASSSRATGVPAPSASRTTLSRTTRVAAPATLHAPEPASAAPARSRPSFCRRKTMKTTRIPTAIQRTSATLSGARL